MVTHQDVFSSGWSLTRGGLSSGWSLIRIVFLLSQGVVSHHRSFTRVVSHQIVPSSGAVFRQGGLSSGCFFQGDLSQGWSFIRVLSHHMVSHQGGLTSDRSFILVVFFIRGGLSPGVVSHQGWSSIRSGLSSGVVGLSSGWSIIRFGLSSGWYFITGGLSSALVYDQGCSVIKGSQRCNDGEDRHSIGIQWGGKKSSPLKCVL